MTFDSQIFNFFYSVLRQKKTYHFLDLCVKFSGFLWGVNWAVTFQGKRLWSGRWCGKLYTPEMLRHGEKCKLTGDGVCVLKYKYLAS